MKDGTMKRLLMTTIAGSFLLLGTPKASALTTTLYDGSTGTLSSSPGWIYLDKRPGAPTASSTQTSDANGTIFDSTTNTNIESGYSRVGTVLNAAAGYHLRFDLQLLKEFRNANASNNPDVDSLDDRAGLSLLIVSSDITKAIELGFFVDRIWAQEDGAIKASPGANPQGTRFTQAEGVAFDTRTNVNQYDLSILNSNYFLYANNNYTTPILAGRLRDYTSEVTTPFPNPYKTANTIFIGDNTTSASAEFRVNQVAFSDSAVTPVPFAFNPLLGFGMFGISRLRKAVRKKAKV
ncbi:MAG TPA: hypothetical protein VL134_01925 [Leptolyngbya sp.]|jgi:hypothetical protein|nr:hypothetical protein [Leptolyngbya sp.]